jgi:poly-gamma-glutamate synthesis protein (capsule biosynthesis protein)
LSELVSSADIVSINLEAPIVNSNSSILPKVGPAIGQSSSVITALKAWGINLFVLANNHIMDYGSEGLRNTIEVVGEEPILGAGMDFDAAYQPHYVTINGTCIALLAFSEAQFGALLEKSISAQAGYAWIDHPAARASIVKARSKADIVIVQAHAGLEMVSLPLPEWRDRYREFIDLGADMVIGHHPHMIQGSENYKGKDIHYSLGNFYMDILADQKLPVSGGVVIVEVAGKEIRSQLIPLQLNLGYVELDTDEQAMKNYRSLCEQITNDTFYMAEIDRICIESWQRFYSAYYEIALNGIGTTPSLKKIMKMAKRMLKKLLQPIRQDGHGNELMLIHNIRIESHRWVVDRALRNLCASGSGDKP